MNRDEQEDTTVYKVILNAEEQYSIWPADRENPLGWRDAGKTGRTYAVGLTCGSMSV
jgi:MbtH protein